MRSVKSFNEFNEIKKTNNIIDDDGHLKDLSDDSVIEKLTHSLEDWNERIFKCRKSG